VLDRTFWEDACTNLFGSPYLELRCFEGQLDVREVYYPVVAACLLDSHRECVLTFLPL